jgi:hypothetical protein
MQVTEYDAKTGCQISTWNLDESLLGILKNPYVEGAYSPLEFYVDVDTSPPKAKTRSRQKVKMDKTSITADGRDIVSLSNLPTPCEVEVLWEVYSVEDGEFQWGTHMPGEYKIRVRAFPYADWEGTVTAV